jgi:hypothetical protein
MNYTPTTLGYRAEEKLHLGVREQKRLNTTAVDTRLLAWAQAHIEHTRSEDGSISEWVSEWVY